MTSINICLPPEHYYRNSSISGNSGIFDGEPCLLPQTDTDVLVILLGMIGRHLTSQRPTAYSCITMDCGSVNSRRHIDVISIANALEAKQKGLAAVMPGLHAFTGSDFPTAFYMKGKIKPLEVLENDNRRNTYPVLQQNCF